MLKKKRIAEEKKAKALAKAENLKQVKLAKIERQKNKERESIEKRMLEKQKLKEKAEQYKKKVKEIVKNKENEKKIIAENEKKSKNLEKKSKDEKVSEILNKKVQLEEMARKRNEEIQKRKFSYYNDKSVIKESNDNTKYFFDENIATKFSNLESDNIEQNIVSKPRLEKKNVNSDENLQLKNKEKKIVTVLNNDKTIAKLKNKTFREKTEIFYYQKDVVELDINQKIKISEYVKQIKNKPIKIEIKPGIINNIKSDKQSNQIAKSRSLLIRAYLVKLGISHNRIKILIKNSDSKGSENEVVLSFIEL